MEWIIALAFIALMFGLLMLDFRRKQARTVEEYEEEVQNEDLGRSMLRAGLLEIEKLNKPQVQQAVEYLKDQQQGQTDEKKTAGDGE